MKTRSSRRHRQREWPPACVRLELHPPRTSFRERGGGGRINRCVLPASNLVAGQWPCLWTSIPSATRMPCACYCRTGRPPHPLAHRPLADAPLLSRSGWRCRPARLPNVPALASTSGLRSHCGHPLVRFNRQPIAKLGHEVSRHLAFLRGYNVRIHRHNDFTGRHYELRKRTLNSAARVAIASSLSMSSRGEPLTSMRMNSLTDGNRIEPS